MSQYDKSYLEFKDILNTIKYYKYQYKLSLDPILRMHLVDLICEELEQLDYLFEQMIIKIDCNYLPAIHIQQNQKQYTLEELGKYDGSKGMPTYVAVNGIIYDVSLEPSWGGGTHFGMSGGKDLSDEFKTCHNAQQILDRLPIVGVLKSNG